MAENNIPYKVRAALLLVPLNTPMPTGAVTQSLWYIAVRSGGDELRVTLGAQLYAGTQGTSCGP